MYIEDNTIIVSRVDVEGMMIIKLAGTVVEVMQAQGLSDNIIGEYTRNRGVQENKTTMKKDFPRTALVDFSGKTHRDFTKECDTKDQHQKHYVQGIFDGGAVVDIYQFYTASKIMALYNELDDLFHHLDHLSPGLEAEAEEINSQAEEINHKIAEFQRDWCSFGARKDLRFAYRDDDGTLCAVGMVSNAKKPDSWVLQIFRHTTDSLELRQTTLFSKGEFVMANDPVSVDLTDLFAEIKLALNSEKLSELLVGIVSDDGVASIEKLDELNRRIIPGYNLGDRESRKLELDGLIAASKKVISGNESFDAYLQDITNRSTSEPDFFQVNRYISTCCNIEFMKNVAIFEEKLRSIEKSEANKKVHEQCVNIFNIIQSIAGSNPSALDSKELSDLNHVLICCSAAIDNPLDTKNKQQLTDLSERISGHASPFWKNLGVALSILAGLIALTLVVGACLGALPTGGVSIALAAVGTLALADIGFFAINTGRESGLAKSVSDFANAPDDCIKPM